MDQPILAFHRVSFGYGASPVLAEFDLAIARGERVALMGESGVGKSTLATLAGGFAVPHAGTVAWSEGVRSHDVVTVDQDPYNGVFPWHTAADNIEYPLRRLRWARADRAARVDELAQAFGLDGLLHRFPAQLSGGQRQRLALARALAGRPRVALLDESLSALDVETRGRTIAAILRSAEQDGTTLVVITHALADALALCERCVVLGGSPARILADERIAASATDPDQEAARLLVDMVRAAARRPSEARA